MTQVFDWPGRMQELAEFVGLDQEGLELIQSTREIILAHGDDLTASVYDNFLDFPDTRRFFADESGGINEERLTRRKHSLMRWLRGSVDFQMDQDYPIRVLAMGIVHSHPPLHRAHLGSVPRPFHDRHDLVYSVSRDGTASQGAGGPGHGGPRGLGMEQDAHVAA